MRILGIETSCDETSVAVLDGDGRVLSNIVSSQLAAHAPYGGVVPEIAARAHLENLPVTFEQALSEAQTGVEGMIGEIGRARTALAADTAGQIDAHGEIWRGVSSIWRLYFCRKKSTSSGMSSRRWRSGGRWMGSTLMR